ncbi:hypothetical protein COLO4_05122 [Corchorus olitorius]|uniref:Uncharacterized protein n=1 Tax=Corchorus olitorius TaxID=93759 RepID=A0A1R3KRV5_9ROSI|nr:hypothetical protein COLO4_05122 [Corchorus olitorius]
MILFLIKDLIDYKGQDYDFVLDEGFVCEGEDSDFVLDEGFVCEGEESEFFIDGKRLESVVSKQVVCDFVWMDIGWLFDHDMNQEKKPNKEYFYKKNTKFTLLKLAIEHFQKHIFTRHPFCVSFAGIVET